MSQLSAEFNRIYLESLCSKKTIISRSSILNERVQVSFAAHDTIGLYSCTFRYLNCFNGFQMSWIFDSLDHNNIYDELVKIDGYLAINKDVSLFQFIHFIESINFSLIPECDNIE